MDTLGQRSSARPFTQGAHDPLSHGQVVLDHRKLRDRVLPSVAGKITRSDSTLATSRPPASSVSAFDAAIARSFSRMATLEVVQADITQLDVDAITDAANTAAAPRRGRGRAISRAAGPELERESRGRAPIGLGGAVETTGGDLPARFVIHAATMELGGPTSADIILRATRSTLQVAERLGAKSLALVAFGTGVGGFPLDEAARIMVGVAHEHDGELERIVFAVHGEEAERAFKEAVEPA